MRVRSAARQAFTLVELLGVISISVVLVSLILPAIQKARESANKMFCAHNLHQLVIAAHDYHVTYQKLPPGYLGAQTPGYTQPFQGASVFAFLLPYLE